MNVDCAAEHGSDLKDCLAYVTINGLILASAPAPEPASPGSISHELCRGVREGNVEMPREVKKDLKEFQTALRLPGTEEQQKTQSAAGPKSGAASPPQDFKVSSTPAAQAQKADPKSSPTAAASMPSSSQPAPASKPPQVCLKTHHDA